MGRTRLRGIELGGIRVAIEVPAHLDWRWPDERCDRFAVAPLGADVHIGVRVAAVPTFSCRGFVYESATHRFEIAQRADGWAVEVYGSGGRERVALFDDGFENGEVILAPSAAADGVAPLAHPLDELVALHRVARLGGLLVRGGLAVRDGRATVFLGGARSASRRDAGSRSPSSQALVGERVVVRVVDDAVRAFAGPWNSPYVASCGRPIVAAINVVHPAHALVAEALDRDAATTELLGCAVAPLHDDRCADRMFDAAAAIVDRVTTLRVGLPEVRRVPGLGWSNGTFASQASPR